MIEEITKDEMNVTMTPDPNSSVKINVKFEDTPVEGASVNLNNIIRKTGSNGSTTFVNILENTYTVIVTNDETTKTETITVDSTHREFIIQLNDEEVEPTLNSEVNVTDENGEPLEDSDVDMSD